MKSFLSRVYIYLLNIIEQFYNELRHECHSIGVHFSKFKSEEEITNKHIINCIVED